MDLLVGCAIVSNGVPSGRVRTIFGLSGGTRWSASLLLIAGPQRQGSIVCWSLASSVSRWESACSLPDLPGLWVWVKTVVVPFLLFCQIIGWVVYVHHIDPEIRWWKRRSWNRFRGQVEGTTILLGPPGWNLFFHWIMVHLPHHVDMRIPCYRLPEAASAIAEAFPDHVQVRRLSVRKYFHATRECKLHDFETGTWSRYPRTNPS